MQERIRDFYTREYPDDDYGWELDEEKTFQDVWDLFADDRGGWDFYDFVGVNDSIIRERIFAELANKLGCDYDVVYDAWRHGRQY